jgi:hypothetical protein
MAFDHPKSDRVASPKRKGRMSMLSFVGIILGVGVGIFLLRVMVGVIVGLIAKFIFGASGNTACFAGVMGYLLPAFAASTLDLFGGDFKKKKG